MLNLTPWFSIKRYWAELGSAAEMDAESRSIEAEAERLEAENVTMLLALQESAGVP